MHASSRTFKPNILVKKIDIGGGVMVRVKIAASEYKKMRGLIG
jgi:ribosomal protein L28